MKQAVITLRNLRPDDGDAVISIHRESIYGLCGDHYTRKEMDAWTAVLTPELFSAGMRDENNVGVAAVDSDTVIGYGFLNVTNREVKALYVSPGCIKRGAGRLIMARLEELAGEKGIATLTLQSTQYAVGFYRKLGYREIGPMKHEIGGVVSLTCVRMEKTLERR